MNIQTKSLVLLFWLILGSNPLIQANNALSTAVVPATTIAHEDTPPCGEPAPTNYQITEILTDRIIVAWDAPASPPFEYNIKAWETSTGNLIYNQNIANNNLTWRVLNLQPNTEYRIRNTPVCSDGTLGDKFVELTGLTLIVDLVVNGFSAPPSYPPSPCTINASGESCLATPSSAYPGYIVKFKVRPKNNETEGRLFGVYKVAGCNATAIMERPEDESSDYQFYCNSQTDPNCSGALVTVKKSGNIIAKFSIGQTVNTGSIGWIGDSSATYEIVRITSATGEPAQKPFSGCGYPTGGKPSPIKGRDDGWGFSSTQTLSANPNPFTDQLDIQTPFNNPTENTKISLYDLQGRLVMASQSPGDQQTINLSTLNLSPGMYFLRAESGGVAETVKVVKTQ